MVKGGGWFEIIAIAGYAALIAFKMQALPDNLNEFAGPLFRYEEEALYPALVEIYGVAYINKLYTDHDIAIAWAKRLSLMFGNSNIQDMDYKSAIEDIRAILPHVSDCEGLSIMVERFDDKIVKKITIAQQNSWKNNLNLFEWSETIRDRKQLHF